MTGPAKISGATLADLLAISEDDRRHEIIDGALIAKEGASGRHGAAQGRLVGSLRPFDRRPGGTSLGGWWFATEVEILLAEDQIYRPDIAGWRRERLPGPPDEWPIRTRPDWVCEVLSTNKRRDVIEKKRGYHRAEVTHYWLVDPREEILSVHRWLLDGYVEVLVAVRGDRVRAEPFDAIELRVGTLFGDDDDEP